MNPFKLKLGGFREITVGLTTDGRRGYWWTDDAGQEHFVEVDALTFQALRELDVMRRQLEFSRGLVSTNYRERDRLKRKVSGLRLALRWVRPDANDKGKETIAWALKQSDDRQGKRRARR